MFRRLAWHSSFFARYAGAQRLRLFALALLLAGSISLQLINPQILRGFIDAAGRGAPIRTLISASTMFVVVALLQQVLSVSSTYMSENVGWTATNALREDLLLHCLRLDPSFHKKRTAGEMIERIDGDVTALANFFAQFIVQMVGNLLLLIGILIILWRLDTRLGLLLSVFTALSLMVMRMLQAYVAPYWKRGRQIAAELYGFLEERMGATEDIRSSRAQSYTMRGLYERMGRHFAAQRAARLRGRGAWTSLDGLFTLGMCAAMALNVHLYFQGRITLGAIFSVFMYIGLIRRPLDTIAQQAEEFQKASAGLARVRELFNTQSLLVETPGREIPDGPLDVELRSVAFNYGEGENALSEIDFRLEPGAVLGLLGRTGSGKTTLTRILFRLYDPTEGAVLVGGVDLRDVALRDLRRRVGIVTQEVQLFHATLRDNLAFFDRSIPDRAILMAIGELGLEPWLKSLPKGLDTMMAAGSGGLSAGEGQLLAFTRIFLRNPGLVVLDEASSRVDPATERLIDQAVQRLLQERTGIIIAHRLETVERANEILILEGGRIAEYGPRLQLLEDPDSRFSTLLRTGMEEALA